MIKLILSVSLISIVAMACSNKDTSKTETKKDTIQTVQQQIEQSKTIANYFKPVGDSLIVPAFDITIQLSGKATQKLSKDNETIIVSAMLSGIPKDTMMKEYREWGEFSLGSQNIELPTPGTAHFDDTKISKKDFELLGSKDIVVLINVYSGRKSTSDNLLDCEILQKQISKVRLQKNVLHGKLIYGE